MIDAAAIKYADKDSALSATDRALKQTAFRQGAFWGLNELLTAVGQAWAFKKIDQKYLDTIKELVSRIEGKTNVPE